MKSEAKALKIQSNDSAPASGPALTVEDLKVLKAPFSSERLCVKVQNFNKDRSRAMLVLYLQHTDVQDRLEEVDPGWTNEVLKEERIGESTYIHLRLTLKGISRENVGEGNDPKGAYSDALKRCAMLFGVGRYLYDSPIVWVDYNDSRDRFRAWTIEDYDRAKTGSNKVSPKVEIKKQQSRSREQLNRILMNLYRPFLTQFPETRFAELLTSRYGVAETRLMTVEQMEDLVQHMEEQLRSAA